jgi:hypothetical protein
MTIDSTIVAAVKEVTDQSGVKKELAKKIIHWVEGVHSGETGLEDKDDVKRRIEILLEGLDDAN